MSKVNTGQASSTLIPKYIGSDFDKVVAVADNIEQVVIVGDNIEDVGTVADNINYVKEVAEDLHGMPVTMYTGENPPVLNPMPEGVMWYCTTDGRTYVWYTDADSGQWVESAPQSAMKDKATNIFFHSVPSNVNPAYRNATLFSTPAPEAEISVAHNALNAPVVQAQFIREEALWVDVSVTGAQGIVTLMGYSSGNSQLKAEIIAWKNGAEGTSLGTSQWVTLPSQPSVVSLPVTLANIDVLDAGDSYVVRLTSQMNAGGSAVSTILVDGNTSSRFGIIFNTNLIGLFDGIRDGVITSAPTENAVYDALQLKVGKSQLAQSGNLNPAADWADVPVYSDPELGGLGGPLNAQANALTARSELLLTDVREALRRSYAEAGYNLVDGSFEQGATLTSATDVLLYEATGECYSWSGTFPKVVPANSSPVSTGGISPTGDWVDVSDASAYSRVFEDLGNDNSQKLVGGVVAASLSDGSCTTLRALGWTFGEDIAPYLAQAANQGFKKVKLGKGVFICSELSINSSDFAGFVVSGVGSGFAYSPQTKIVPVTPTQDKLFHSPAGVSGADAVRFEKLMLDGNGTCGYGVDQLSGAGWEYEDLQLRGFTEWALWAIQGLNYYNRIYQFGVAGGKGIALYSDYFANNIETSGGELGIRIMAGGGRLNNILSNSQTDCCIEISPLDASTTHINTAMSNIYIGEIYNQLVKPHLRIKGTLSQRVRDVQISNINTVSAVTSAGAVKHNLHIEVEEAEVIINGWAARGIDAYETADLYDEGALKATNSKVILASGSIHGISRKPVEVVNSNVQIGSGVRFTDWGGAYASGDNIAAVLCNDTTSIVTIADGVNFKNNRVSSWKAVKGISGTPFKIGRIVTNTPNPVEVVANPPAFEFTMPLDNTLYERGRRVSVHGTASTPSGGGSVFLYSFPSIPEDQSYEVTAQQVGNGDNAAVGRVFIGNEKSGVVTTGCTQTDTLAVSFSMSGAALVLTCGSGYTLTTWAFSIRRSM